MRQIGAYARNIFKFTNGRSGADRRPEGYGRAAPAAGQKASRRLSLIATVSAFANIRHERFCQLYVKLGNASEAYRRPGRK